MNSSFHCALCGKERPYVSTAKKGCCPMCGWSVLEHEHEKILVDAFDKLMDIIKGTSREEKS